MTVEPSGGEHTVYVGIGANLGDPLAAVRLAVDELRRLADTEVERVSSIYRSAPLGVSDVQPDYLNAVARLRTGLGPDTLLAGLQAIERRHGRRRERPNQSRTLDLDLLLYDDRVASAPALTLPHPRMHQRAFVLHPLVEIAPEATIPGHGTARSLLPAVAGQRIERLPELV